MAMENIKKFCRICAKKFEKHNLSTLIPIFEKGGKNSEQIRDRINTCLPVSVFKDDGLPQQICKDCKQRINIAYNISECSVHAEEKLRLLTFKPEPETQISNEKTRFSNEETGFSNDETGFSNDETGFSNDETGFSNDDCDLEMDCTTEEFDSSSVIPDTSLNSSAIESVKSNKPNTAQKVDKPNTVQKIEVLTTQKQSKVLPKLQQEVREPPPKVTPPIPGSAIAVIVAEKTKKKNLKLRIVLVPKDNSSVPISQRVAHAIKLHKQRIQERRRQKLDQQVACPASSDIAVSGATPSVSDSCDVLVCTEQAKLSLNDMQPQNCNTPVCETSEPASKHLKCHSEKQIKNHAEPSNVKSKSLTNENKEASVVNLGDYYPNLSKQKAAIQTLKILTKATDHPGIKQDMKSQVMTALRKFLSNDQSHVISKQLATKVVLSDTHCTICFKKSASKIGLYRHCIKFHRPRVECPYCIHCKKILRLYGTEMHLKVYHPIGKYLLCRICDTEYNKTGLEQPHMLLAPQVYCPVTTCSEHFSTYKLLTAHAFNVHGISNYHCDHCGKTFRSQLTIATHMLNYHLPKESFICDVCGRKLTSALGLKLHKNNMHTVQEQCVCDICGKIVPKYALKSHVFNHVYYSQKRECASCHKILKIKAWHKHRKYHAKHGPDSVISKGKSIGSQSAPRKYKERQSVSVPSHQRVECTICHRFYLAGYMKTHMRYHNNERDFACALCDKKYAAKNALTCHIQEIHLKSGHHCQYCSKYFYRKESLLGHEALHRGERNFKCPYCPKYFPGKRNVQCHIWYVHKRKITPMKSENVPKKSDNVPKKSDNVPKKLDVSKSIVQLTAAEFSNSQITLIEGAEYVIPDCIVNVETQTCEMTFKLPL